MTTEVKADPQMGFAEEIFDQELESKVSEQLEIFSQENTFLQREASKEALGSLKRRDKARKDIKDLIPLDGHEHRYRVNGHVIIISSEREGGPVQDRKPSQSIKIETASED